MYLCFFLFFFYSHPLTKHNQLFVYIYCFGIGGHIFKMLSLPPSWFHCMQVYKSMSEDLQSIKLSTSILEKCKFILLIIKIIIPTISFIKDISGRFAKVCIGWRDRHWSWKDNRLISMYSFITKEQAILKLLLRFFGLNRSYMDLRETLLN